LLQGPWNQSPAATGEKFDFILDVIGGWYEAASLRLLKSGGQLAAVGATGPDVDRVGYGGMLSLLLGVTWKTLLGKLGLGHKYHL
jgi:NADPH:quinone reductase-like Zn-dependent oxidoreductase